MDMRKEDGMVSRRALLGLGAAAVAVTAGGGAISLPPPMQTEETGENRYLLDLKRVQKVYEGVTSIN
jgi:hypothetical protein